MVTNLPVFQSREVGKFAYLEAVPRSQHNSTIPRLKFLDDGLKKRYVRRILQVDPDLSIRLGSSRRTAAASQLWCRRFGFYRS